MFQDKSREICDLSLNLFHEHFLQNKSKISKTSENFLIHSLYLVDFFHFANDGLIEVEVKCVVIITNCHHVIKDVNKITYITCS